MDVYSFRKLMEDYDTKVARAMTREEIINHFAYHAPTPEKRAIHEQLNDAFMELALLLKDITPDCADQTVALRQLMLARMAANLTVACND